MASPVLHQRPASSATPAIGTAATDARSSRDESLYEIVNGQRVQLAPMSAYSPWIASRLQARLGAFVEDRSLGTAVAEMLFILDKVRDLRRRPDVAFVSAPRWPLDRPIPTSDDWEVVPDLAVEVVSPNDLADDLLAKVREYFEHGVRLVWVIYPTERQAYVYNTFTQVRVLGGDDELDGGDIVPGFRIALTKLFQPPGESAGP